MTPKEEAADLIAQGAIQLSRKYREVGIPPTLLEGTTFLDVLRERDPILWQRLEGVAKNHVTRDDRSAHRELSPEVFNEFLQQTGRSPSIPPAPFTSWGDYWKARRATEGTPAPDGGTR